MPNYATPGVYYESVDTESDAIASIRTDIAAFVGIAQKGPVHKPTPVNSWKQFQATFGNFIANNGNDGMIVFYLHCSKRLQFFHDIFQVHFAVYRNGYRNFRSGDHVN